MMRMMKGRLPLALLGNDRLVQGAWCVGFADIPRFRLAVPTPNLIDPSQVAYRAEPPPTRCAVLASPPPGSSATHRALPIDTASPATSPRGGICGWVFYLLLYTFEDSASPHPIAVVTFLHSFSHIRSVYRVSHLFLAHWQPRGSCRWCPDESTSTTPVVSISIHRFIFQSPETSIKYVGSWGDPRPRRCCHRQPSGGLHRT